MFPRPLPRLRACALGAALLLGACSRGADPLAAERDEPFVDFVATQGLADVWTEVPSIPVGSFAARRYMTSGWSVPGKARDEDISEKASLWSDSTDTRLTFWLRERAPRRVTFSASAFRSGLDELGLSVLLNGTPVLDTALTAKRQRVTVELPAELQQVGANELRLQFAQRFLISEHVEGGDHRRVTASLGDFRFETTVPAAAHREESARALLPEGSRAATEGIWAGRAVEQLARTGLSHTLRVPTGARFRAYASYEREDGGPDEIVFRLRATADDGRQLMLIEQPVSRDAGAVPLEASLAYLEGQLVRLDFEVDAPGTEAPAAVGTWIAPQLLADPPAPEAPPSAVPPAARDALRGRNVLAVLIDAANPSYISCYGGREGLTPNIDRLAAEGLRFEHAFSEAAYTIAAVPSVLTSRYTWEHGTWYEGTRLSTAVPTWPEAFRAAGYRTVAVVHSPNGSSLFGVERGFDEFREVFRETGPDRRETPLAEYALPEIDEVLAAADGRPLLLWLHICEPHEPYQPPAPWKGSLDPDYTGSVTSAGDDLWAIRRHQLVPTPREVEHLRREYQENLAYVDHVLGQVRERFERAGLWDDTVVALFSDHGEGFLEHEGKVFSGLGHGTTVYSEMTRIPLILRLPVDAAPRGAVAEGLASNLDLFPTLADLTGVEPPPGPLRGRSLAATVFDPRLELRHELLSHSASRHGRRFLPALAIQADGYKYIHESGDPEELYDLRSDPGERENLAAREPVRTAYLRCRLRAISGLDLDAGGISVGGVEETELDPAAVDLMRALGYLGDSQ